MSEKPKPSMVLADMCAIQAVAPLEGQELPFGVAVEMASANVAARIEPIIDGFLAEIAAEARRERDEWWKSKDAQVDDVVREWLAERDEKVAREALLGAAVWFENDGGSYGHMGIADRLRARALATR